jgi:hypothetical protein
MSYFPHSLGKLVFEFLPMKLQLYFCLTNSYATFHIKALEQCPTAYKHSEKDCILRFYRDSDDVHCDISKLSEEYDTYEFVRQTLSQDVDLWLEELNGAIMCDWCNCRTRHLELQCLTFASSTISKNRTVRINFESLENAK